MGRLMDVHLYAERIPWAFVVLLVAFVAGWVLGEVGWDDE